MCKDVCERTEEGLALWQRWRERRDNWQAVKTFHDNAIIAAMREASQGGAPFTIFACERMERPTTGEETHSHETE